MPVIIDQRVEVAWQSEDVTKTEKVHKLIVNKHLLKEVKGSQFIGMARNPQTARFIFDDGAVKLTKSRGFNHLMELREAAMADLEEVKDEEVSFFEKEAPAAKKRKKEARFELTRKREEIVPVEITVPEHSDARATTINVLSSAHPADALYVQLTSASIEAVIKYVVSEGIEPEEEQVYEKINGSITDRHAKLWKMGNGRKAVKENGKFVYVKKEQQDDA